MDGGDGNDRLKAHAGDDTLGGANGDDMLAGGPGNNFRREVVRSHVVVTDTGITGVGTDDIHGELPLIAVVVDSRVRRGLRLDARNYARPITLIGGAGNDTLTGTMHGDVLLGRAGNDRLNARDEADLLFGEAGNDTLRGGAGTDGLHGGDANDRVFGDGDTLSGGAGDDEFDGSRSEIDETSQAGCNPRGRSPIDS